MHKKIILLGIHAALFGSIVFASDAIDSDLMQRIEDTTKSVDSNISLKNAKAASADANELEELLGQVEAYYVKKGDAADAIGFSRKSAALAAELVKSVAAHDFDAASDTVSSLVKSCKACHQVYKKG